MDESQPTLLGIGRARRATPAQVLLNGAERNPNPELQFQFVGNPFLGPGDVAVDLLQCDLVNCGGFTGMKKIAALAEAHYVGLAPHNPNGPVATMMNLQFAASIPNYSQLESTGSEADGRLWREFLGTEVPLANGCLTVSCAPGIGVALNEAALDNHPYWPRDGWR
jgi:hypothetical protein